MLAEGKVGSVLAAPGVPQPVTFDYTGALRTSPWFLQEAIEGNVYYANTGAAGTTHEDFATSAPFAVSNPRNSGVNIIPIVATWGYVSGTLGAGYIALGKYVMDEANILPTGTAAASSGSCLMAGSAAAGPTGKAIALQATTLTAAATVVLALHEIAPKLATTAVEPGGGPANVIPLPPCLVFPPGTSCVLGGVTGAGGTSPVVTLGLIWVEIKRLA